MSGDSDFVPAIEVAKHEAVSIALYHHPDRRRVHGELWDACDERFELNSALLTKLIIPAAAAPRPPAK